MKTETIDKKLRTNSKEVKTAIQQYILDCIYTDEYDNHDGTIETSLKIVANETKRVAFTEYELHQNKTYQKAFRWFLQGLPSFLNIEYYDDEILKLMASWGLPKPENKTEEQGIDLFYNLIYVNFCDLCKKYKISFPV